jgi:membrane dipeptidase
MVTPADAMTDDRSPGVEGHSDLMIDVCFRRLRGQRGVLRDVYVPLLRGAGVDLEVLTVGGDMQMFVGDHEADRTSEAIRVIDAFWTEYAEADGAVRPVLAAEDAVRDTDSLGCLLHLEGAAPFGGSLELVRTFFRLGVRSVGLTWNHGNEVGDGCLESRGGGLTAFGADVLGELERLGMLIDVSHASDRLVDDVLAATSGAVVASHSNARAVCDHPRNLRDEHLVEIAGRGGVVGVVFYPAFVTRSESPSIGDVSAHIGYLAELIGIEHVGIGPDFTDMVDQGFWKSASFHEISHELTRPFPAGLETVAHLPALRAELTREGYSDADIDSVMGGNFARVFREVLPPRRETTNFSVSTP